MRFTMLRKLFFLAALIVLPNIAASVIIHVPEDYPTIQLAADNCSSGDEIVVAPGVYGPVRIDSLYDVTFTGAGFLEPRKTVIDVQDSSVGFWVWYSQKIVVQGFEIRNCWEGCLAFEYSQHCIARNNYLHDCNDIHGNGLGVRCCDDITANNNIIVSNYEIAVYVDPVPQPHNPSKNLKFINNTIGFTGIGSTGADGVTIAWSDTGLYYVNNISAYNSDYGLNFKYAVQTHTSIIKYNDHYNNNYGPWGSCQPTDTCIYVDPLFVGGTGAEAFFLDPHSPCIDAGDPTIFDPDGTRSDIGALYYDQGPGLFEILVRPGNMPAVVPAMGGVYRISVGAENRISLNVDADIWGKLYGPHNYIINPIFGYADVPFQGFERIYLRPTIVIPASAPPGQYRLTGYIGAFPASIADSLFFMFGKSSTQDYISDENRGELTAEDESKLSFNIHPNPFNAEGILSMYLPKGGEIGVTVYDILGRAVETVAEGYYPAGTQRFAISSAKLSNGVYFGVIIVGGKVFTQKFAVVK